MKAGKGLTIVGTALEGTYLDNYEQTQRAEQVRSQGESSHKLFSFGKKSNLGFLILLLVVVSWDWAEVIKCKILVFCSHQSRKIFSLKSESKYSKSQNDHSLKYLNCSLLLGNSYSPPRLSRRCVNWWRPKRWRASVKWPCPPTCVMPPPTSSRPVASEAWSITLCWYPGHATGSRETSARPGETSLVGHLAEIQYVCGEKEMAN